MAIKIGVSDFRYAKLTQDSAVGVTYGTITAVPGLASLEIKVASDSSTFFADNGPYALASALGDITVDIELADLPLEAAADLLGHSVSAGVMNCSAHDVAPEVAIGFVGLKSNGKKRYVWLLKGQFSIPDDSYKTKGDKVEFQSQKISATFAIRTYDGQYKKVGDEDATGWVATAGTNWFTVDTIKAGA